MAGFRVGERDRRRWGQASAYAKQGKGKGKKKGLRGSLTTCTTTDTFEDPEVGTVDVDLTVTGFFTPRKG